MRCTKEIYSILSHGGFISSDSPSPAVHRYCGVIEKELTDYYEYYKSVGSYFESGNGYYFFTRKESKASTDHKLEAAAHWIDYLCFLKTYNSAFGPGFMFGKSDIVTQIRTEIELKEQTKKPFSGKKGFEEIVDKFINELKAMGFVEYEDEDEDAWKVLTAFRYIEESVDCINITEEGQDEIPE